MEIGERVKQYLGLNRHTPYVEEYFELSNARSSIYLSSVIIVLEIWMIVSAIIRHFTGVALRTDEWLVKHLVSYFILLISSTILLIYAVRFITKKKTIPAVRYSIDILFSIIAIAFGIYISYLDYVKGEQFVTLITMIIFVFCFISWRPILSVGFLTTTFVIFLTVCHSAIPLTYATMVNIFIFWIAILMSSVNSYNQLVKIAYRTEQLEANNKILEELSKKDEVTGIFNMIYFREKALKLMNDESVDVTKKLFLFLDIEHFKYYNDKYGFWEGNAFLRKFAATVRATFNDALVAHFSNDNFVIFTDDIYIQQKLDILRAEIHNPDLEVKMALKVGAYRPEDRSCLPVEACDHARYACYSIKKHYDLDYCEYDEKMAKAFYRNQYIINNLDSAIENNYIKVYYQPVIDARTGNLCGAEALARWDDPRYGFLSPADFIQTLEEYHLIHKLDMHVVKKVCQDISEYKKSGKKTIPISLNFSRLDFEYIDLAQEVEKHLFEFEMTKDDIHIEITESALTENNEKLRSSLNSLRSSGHSLWLDDFGAGYSGLNVLKEYDFDVMKIDMKFLSNFEGNEKAKTLLRNIVSLSKELGMQSLSEGVETEEACKFLQSIGCERLQGYLFGRPMPKEEFMEKITTGVYHLED